MGIDWDSVGGDFERYPKLKFKVGDKVSVTFVDDGSEVKADRIQVTEEMKKAKVKPRDSYVFVVDVGGEKKEWWIGSTNYSVLRQLKVLRDENGGTLEGLKANIKRVSDAVDETNYEIAKQI